MANRILTFPSLNVSIQVGDMVYYTEPESNMQSGTNSPTNVNNNKPKKLGLVTSVNHAGESVMVDDSFGSPPSPVITTSMMYMFQKNKKVNTSGIIGYYAETEYRNHSTLPAEIFATAVDYVESSK